MTRPAIIETPQQRADRLLAQHQTDRNRRRASRMVLKLSDDPLPEPSRIDRIVKALEPWFVGFHNPYMDAAIVASLLISAATLTALCAMTWGDLRAPPASGASSATMEATSRPVAASPRGDGATEAVR